MDLVNIYQCLLEKYGPQGWWPLTSHLGTNPTKTGATQGYHPMDYTHPKNTGEEFEIAVGSILTQNTAWTNVEKAIKNLLNAGILNDPKALLSYPINDLKNLIKPSGYFNQKSTYLLEMAKFFIQLNKKPTRDDIIKIKGVGNETADTILLYAFKEPFFIIDGYTKRFLEYHSLASPNLKYLELQELFHLSLPRNWKIYQEFHALLVEHGKHCFTKKPFRDSLIFNDLCLVESKS